MFEATRLDEKGREMCGSDSNALIRLKTIEGAVNRIQGSKARLGGTWVLRRGYDMHSINPKIVHTFFKEGPTRPL